MAYLDKTKQRQYQREWRQERRRVWFSGKTCDLCGSSEYLELHHVDAACKVSHRLWSWSEARRMAELSKCVARCRRCHAGEHNEERRAPCGTASAYSRGCRCASCREAKRLQMASYRARTRHMDD